MTDWYQEHPSDTWNSNGASYNLNKIFKLAHNKPVEQVATKEFEKQVRRSKREVDGERVCGSCFGHTKDIVSAHKHHDERVEMTDVSIPIIAMKDGDDWRVVDGAHRVEKAVLHSIKELSVKVLKESDIRKARLD